MFPYRLQQEERNARILVKRFRQGENRLWVETKVFNLVIEPYRDGRFPEIQAGDTLVVNFEGGNSHHAKDIACVVHGRTGRLLNCTRAENVVPWTTKRARLKPRAVAMQIA